MKKIIVGIGEILWDVFPEGKVLGGAPANFAYHVSQFGLEGFAVSAIGRDELGAEIMQTLSEKQLKTLIAETDYPTGTVQVSLEGKGIPHYEIKEQVAWDHIPFTPALEALASSCRAVCFGSLAQRNEVSRTTILQFLNAVPFDAMKIFDINLRQHFYSKALIEESLKLCNVLKLNEEELVLVAEIFNYTLDSDQEVVRRLMQDFALEIVVLTKGTDGSYVFCVGETSFLPTPLVAVADTVGAGDSFTAAFVASLLKGKSIDQAHQKAVEVSAFVCTQQGAMPVLPTDLITD